jgi:uncharacterized protein YdeI (YjbR/CyaY-like superfamily)
MEADIFFMEGCGRCSLGGTPACKVHTWQGELALLREILLQSGLTETRKWGVACYMYDKKNIVLLGALKSCATLSFFKGSLLSDPEKLLHTPGENSQAARYMKFTQTEQVMAQSGHIAAYLQEAIMLEKQGAKVDFKKEHHHQWPDELQLAFDEDPALKNAFENLTPGRQRGYLLFFTAAKQSVTRIQRIAKNKEKIMQGKGLQE